MTLIVVFLALVGLGLILAAVAAEWLARAYERWTAE